ncbi:MAG: B12-binding domain-containing radical SAM protein [Alphaproteobacteria bacterium]|nr:B12-binding domain-containing radical SAM protein [Alphaproteobacteria bacterium]
MRVLLVVYDNGSQIHMFPMGTAYIAAALRAAGHEVGIWQQDVHHHPDEMLTTVLDEGGWDVVGIGVIAGYWQYRKLLGLSRAIERAKKRPFYMLGGHGPTADVSYFLNKTGADAVVMGEGEVTVVELMRAIGKERRFEDVEGLAWRDGPEIRVNPRRPLIADMDSIPLPAWDMFPMEYYRLQAIPGATRTDFVMTVLSGRGCTFTCTFCYRMDTGHRARSHDSILDEIEHLQKRWGITFINFLDELLMTSKERTMAFCERVLERDVRFRWWCNGRINYAVPEVLALMKRAGCVFINYGIESVDNGVLKNMRKAARVEQIEPAIANTLAAGISPGLNMIWGNIGDSRETLDKAVEFLIAHDDGAELRTIRPVTPYPGSPLYEHAIRMGLIEDCADFYERKHTNSDLLTVNFTELGDDAFYEALEDANRRLLTNYHDKRLKAGLDEVTRLYRERNAAFRGFRPV